MLPLETIGEFYITFLLGGVIVLVIMRNIFVIKRLENKLKSTRIQINGVGHDLRNKITTIQLYTQMMMKKYPKQGNRILLEIENMLEIIENLTIEVLNEDKRLKLKKEKFDLVGFLKGIIDIKRALYSDHKIVFITELGKSPIVADKISLDRIVQNIIQNAVKYSLDNTTITVRVVRFNHSYRISIKDQGRGIPESEEHRVFNAYEQLGRSQGMGLGLYIVKTLVEEHGGRIYFESEVGHGTTFYVELPRE